jgi:hypothetical protein
MTPSSPGKTTHPLRIATLALLTLLSLHPTARAQSLDRTAPAPLQAATNAGTLDSFVGGHYWYFWAEPGHFQVNYSAGGPEGLGASGSASIDCGFSRPTPGSHITFQSSPGGTVFSGSVTQRTRVGILVRPPNSPLIRSTVSYTLAASGNVVFDTRASAAPAVAGMYTPTFPQVSGSPALGSARFNPDGTIETTNGQTGTWRLFDGPSATYVVVLAGQRLSVHFDPGRGFINPRDGSIFFVRSH